MAKNENIFSRLTTLFRSGPVVKRRVREYKPSDVSTSAYELFRKTQSNVYSTAMSAYGAYDRMARYSDFQEMEYCLHEDTLIAVPGGYKTIGELAKDCEKDTDHTFVVYSYDHNESRIVPAIGKQARQTRVDHAYAVTFDNGQKIIGTPNHRLMKRDGTFCKIEDLKPDDAMMPFYRRDLFNGCKEEGKGYRWIYTMDRRSKMNGWTTEHRLLAEMIKGSQLDDNEVVHHLNFNKNDNRIENLQIMIDADHKRLHTEIINGKKWSDENASWIEEFKLKHSKFMTENNPAERKDITFGRILETCESVGFNLYRLCDAFDTDPNVIKRRLRRHGYDNFETFASAYSPDWQNAGWDNTGELNPRYIKSVTFDKICEKFSKGMKKKNLANTLGVTTTVIDKRLRDRGYKNYTEFNETYNNLKVSSIEYHGIIPLFDLTVDGYKNFATDTVISHNTPEIASALDIYSEETVSPDEKGNILHIYSENAQIQRLLNELFFDTLNVNFNMTSWVRNMCKYGDFFLFNDVSPDHGVINVFPISVNEIEREEGFDKDDPLAVRYRWVTQGNQTLQNWQVSHFRLLGNDAFLPYGTSVLEAARRIWRQMILVEDAMLVYRIVRAPDRRVFYVDVGNVPPEEIPNYMEQAQATLKKSQVIDRASGRVDLRYNPMSVDEDYFIPVRGGSTGTKVENLAGGANAAAIEDVQYIQKKLFSALKIPKAYLGYDEGLGAKATLSQEDIRFSRSINRIQRTIVSELNKLAIVHLYCNGFDGHDLLDFDLKLTNPSTIAQQQKLELYNTKFTIAASAKNVENIVDHNWIRKNIFMMPDEEIALIEKGLFEDKMQSLELEAVKLPEPPGEPGSGAPAGGGGGNPAAERGTETPGGAIDLSGPEEDRSPITAADSRNPFKLPRVTEFDRDSEIDLSRITTSKGMPLRAFAGLTRQKQPASSLLGEKTNIGPDYAEREIYNRSRRKAPGTAGTTTHHAHLVGSDKKDPRDSIAHPFGEKEDLINPLKNAHKVKIDETEEFVDSYLDDKINDAERRDHEVKGILKSLDSISSRSNTAGEKK
jgi:hypothetical protein